jgi:predicted ATP-dependent endonuclease of OLD family
VVEDDLGVEVELDQRSAGFQWLVSFFVVFKAQAEDEFRNAILLLDEPGLSLHALKQRQFRHTVSKISEANQTIYTTHSPFMVGASELPIVRVVEMTDRKAGTKVHLHVVADDPRSIFPLQEALGYDLAQSLFGQERNLVCEGLTDYWYIDGIATLFRDAKIAELDQKIALVPAGNASRVAYYATILHSQHLKVAALLDSDQEGDNAAVQDEFVGLLGDKKIIRTKDIYQGPVTRPEIEDLLRETLVKVARDELGWDISATASSQPNRPIVDIFTDKVSRFSKYRLAKTFLRWIAVNDVDELTSEEQDYWRKLIDLINKALK